jgi:putative peptidoglycan binding protein
MKRILYSISIGTLALALTAWGEQVQGTTNVRTKARGAVSAHRAGTGGNVRSSAAMRTRASVSPRGFQPRASATVRERNMAGVRPTASRGEVTAAYRQRNAAVARERSTAMARERNTAVTRERNAAVARERNAAVARQRSTAMTNERNARLSRERNLAMNRQRNATFARGRNMAFTHRQSVANARVTNNWQGARFSGRSYAAFRNYQRQWHDRGWWRSHYDRIVFVNGGWWYWNAGYWFPAWGYDPYAYYSYDGPIYGYNGLPPNQVVVDVQAQLQRDGYYSGPVDGALGPMTRQAIAAYQADHGLAITSAVDEPTLSSLGLA